MSAPEARWKSATRLRSRSARPETAVSVAMTPPFPPIVARSGPMRRSLLSRRQHPGGTAGLRRSLDRGMRAVQVRGTERDHHPIYAQGRPPVSGPLPCPGAFAEVPGVRVLLRAVSPPPHHFHEAGD